METLHKYRIIMRKSSITYSQYKKFNEIMKLFKNVITKKCSIVLQGQFPRGKRAVATIYMFNLALYSEDWGIIYAIKLQNGNNINIVKISHSILSII